MSEKVEPSLAVLFVCLGNICRSPMAEGAFRQAAREAGLDCRVDSVGTAGYHIGESPDPRAIATARKHGVDISGLQGRQLAPSDFEEFTHIFALDTANLAGIRSRAPRSAESQISLLLDAVPGREGQTVADPYYGDEEDFERVWRDISVAVEHVVEKLKGGG
ncbi:MAG: low molecular weight protein-tyrosine-phosphatase [Pseudomonadota bacterium]